MIQAGVIYKIINNINQKLYIGQTTDFKGRIRQHKRARSEYSLLHRAIRKHKWHNFSVIKLHENIPFKDLEWLEKHCILIYNTLAPNGYNLKYGGDRGLASEETKRKIRDATRGEKNKNYRKDLRDQKDDIIKKYQSGSTLKSIAEEYKCNPNLIRTILIENGFEPIRRLKPKQDNPKKSKPKSNSKRIIRQSIKHNAWGYEEEIIKMYLDEYSLVDIAEKYKCSNVFIMNMLIKNNIPRRENHTNRTKDRLSKSGSGRNHTDKTKKLMSKRNNERLYSLNGLNLKKWRTENCFSRKQLANQVGCSESTIQNWELNKSKMSKEYYEKWKNSLKFDPIEKFGLINEAE